VIITSPQVSGQTASFINYLTVVGSIPSIVVLILFGAASDAVRPCVMCC
jgi:hypothetical protein